MVTSHGSEPRASSTSAERSASGLADQIKAMKIRVVRIVNSMARLWPADVQAAFGNSLLASAFAVAAAVGVDFRNRTLPRITWSLVRRGG
jgi:hypothetical protein